MKKITLFILTLSYSVLSFAGGSGFGGNLPPRPTMARISGNHGSEMLSSLSKYKPNLVSISTNSPKTTPDNASAREQYANYLDKVLTGRKSQLDRIIKVYEEQQSAAKVDSAKKERQAVEWLINNKKVILDVEPNLDDAPSSDEEAQVFELPKELKN